MKEAGEMGTAAGQLVCYYENDNSPPTLQSSDCFSPFDHYLTAHYWAGFKKPYVMFLSVLCALVLLTELSALRCRICYL